MKDKKNFSDDELDKFQKEYFELRFEQKLSPLLIIYTLILLIPFGLIALVVIVHYFVWVIFIMIAIFYTIFKYDYFIFEIPYMDFISVLIKDFINLPMNGINVWDPKYNHEVNSEFLCKKLLSFNETLTLYISSYCNNFFNYNFIISGIIFDE